MRYSLFMSNETFSGSDALLDQVFNMKETFIVAVSRYHATLNLAQDFEGHETVASAWSQCIENHSEAVGDDAMRHCEEERKAWVKDARKQVALVMKSDLPWTIRSANTFWPLPKK